MYKIRFKRGIILALVFILAFAVTAPACFAQEGTDDASSSSLVVTEYTIYSPQGKALSSLSKGSKFNLDLKLKNTSIKTSDIGIIDNLDITKLLDSFTQSGATHAIITSQGDDPLTVSVMFEGLTYSGKGNSFKFMAGYKNLSLSYDEITFSINECREYVDEPKEDEEDEVYPAPIAQISRSDLEGTIKPGDRFSVTIRIKNHGDSDMVDPVAVFTTSDSLALLDNSSSKVMSNIRSGKTSSITLDLMALDEITNPSQYVNVEFAYSYDNGTKMERTSATERVNIPCSVKKAVDTAPTVRITRMDMSLVEADMRFLVTLKVENLSDTAIKSPRLSFTASDSLMILENSSSKILSDILPGASQTVSVSMKSLETITSPSQGLDVEMKYIYESGNTKTEATSSEHLIIPCDTKTSNSAEIGKPNVIVSRYSYGGSSVAAGNTFDLALSFINTSSDVKVENIVMTLDTEEGLSIASSSNTAFYKSLGAGKSQDKTIQLKALPTASGPVKITVTFKYEYVDDGKRTEVTTSENITVPIYQADRFEITPSPSGYAMQYSETYLSLSYVNKGKSVVSNVQAEIVGDVTSLTPIQNLGNIESGKSGTIDFIITPDLAGSLPVTIKVTYEDANLNTVTREYPMTLEVQEYVTYDDPGMYPEEPVEEKPEGIPLWIWIGAAVVVGAVVVIVVIKRKKKKANKARANDFKWDEDDFEEKPLSGVGDKKEEKK